VWHQIKNHYGPHGGYHGNEKQVQTEINKEDFDKKMSTKEKIEKLLLVFQAFYDFSS